MLKYNMSALRSQRKRVKGDKRYREAYKAGRDSGGTGTALRRSNRYGRNFKRVAGDRG
jgi:hypothetical protein